MDLLVPLFDCFLPEAGAAVVELLGITAAKSLDDDLSSFWSGYWGLLVGTYKFAAV